MNAIASQPSAKLTDKELRTALQSKPGLLETMRADVTAAYQAIARTPVAENLGLAAYWNNVLAACSAARPLHSNDQAEQRDRIMAASVAQLRVLMNARAAMTAVLADLARISRSDLETLQSRDPAPGTRMAVIRPVMQRYPGLAAWQAVRDAEGEALAAQQQADTARLQQAREAERKLAEGAAARTLLRRLALEGVHLSIGKAGGILAHPAGMLTDEFRSAITAHKDALAVLLSDAPEVIA